jgi:hypothetical protein
VEKEDPSDDEPEEEVPTASLNRTPRKKPHSESDDEEGIDSRTPLKRMRQTTKKLRKTDYIDSDPESEPQVFARNPNKACTGILNYKRKTHFKIYEAAVKSLYSDATDRYNMDVIGAIGLLQKINDRCSDLGLKILYVPANDNELKKLLEEHDSFNSVNICHYHGTISKDLINSYVKTFVNLPCREAQEDDMLCSMLQNSLTEKAYQMVTRDPKAYMVDGEKSGLLLLKAILDQSAIDSSIDPDVVRKELAHAYLMFRELKYDVRAFHDWVQRKLNALKQTGHASTDVATHLLTAYKTSNDDQLRLYIDRLEDIARDSGSYLHERDLMNKVKMKFDSLETTRKLEAIARRDDDIVALKAKLEKLKKRHGELNGNDTDEEEDDESSGDEDSEDDETSEDESAASSVGCRVRKRIKAVGAFIAE